MDDCDTLSFQCQQGDHETCDYIWIGAPAKPPGKMKRIKAMRMICRCDCKHRPQRRAEQAVRTLRSFR